MQTLRRWLIGIPTLYLAAFIALTDVLLMFGVAPFEVYARSRVLTHGAGTGFLVGVLLVNLGLLALLGGAMLVSSVLVARGVKRAARVTLPVRRSARVPVRSRRSGY